MAEFFEKVATYLEGLYIGFSEIAIVFFCVVAVTALFAFAVKSRKSGKFNSSAVTYGGIAIALSMVLNIITLFSMPNGGSVTLGRIIPLLVYAYLFGFPQGAIVGAIYGVLDFIAKPYFLNVFQFLLDYPLAYACCAFAAVFRNNEKLSVWSLLIGTVIAGVGRFLFSTVSGVLYWGILPLASMAYNSVLLVDTAVCLVIIFILTRSKSFCGLLESKKVKRSE